MYTTSIRRTKRTGNSMLQSAGGQPPVAAREAVKDYADDESIQAPESSKESPGSGTFYWPTPFSATLSAPKPSLGYRHRLAEQSSRAQAACRARALRQMQHASCSD